MTVLPTYLVRQKVFSVYLPATPLPFLILEHAGPESEHKPGGDLAIYVVDDRSYWKLFHRVSRLGDFVSAAQRPLPAALVAVLFVSVSCSPTEKKKVAPFPISASAQIRPPCFRTMRCTVASPIPVPSNSSALCNR